MKYKKWGKKHTWFSEFNIFGWAVFLQIFTNISFGISPAKSPPSWAVIQSHQDTVQSAQESKSTEAGRWCEGLPTWVQCLGTARRKNCIPRLYEWQENLGSWTSLIKDWWKVCSIGCGYYCVVEDHNRLGYDASAHCHDEMECCFYFSRKTYVSISFLYWRVFTIQERKGVSFWWSTLVDWAVIVYILLGKVWLSIFLLSTPSNRFTTTWTKLIL